MQNQVKNLINIGLSEKEAIVYFAMASLGECTAYKIAKTTKIKEPTVYTIIESLKTKGLVVKIANIKKQVYEIVDLEKYIDKISDSVINARKINEEIKRNNKIEKPRVIVFEGLEEVKKAVWYGLDDLSNKILYQTYGPIDLNLKKQIDSTYIKWNKHVKNINIKQKVLLSKKTIEKQKELLQFIEKDKFEVRILEDIDFPANISLDVNEEFVSIFSTDPFQATIITDKKLIKILTEYHKYFWDRAKLL